MQHQERLIALRHSNAVESGTRDPVARPFTNRIETFDAKPGDSPSLLILIGEAVRVSTPMSFASSETKPGAFYQDLEGL